MPLLQAMAERFNQRFRRDNVGEVDPKALAPETSLPLLASALGIATTDAEMAFLAGWPVGLQQAVRALLESAVKRRQPVALTWAPGYDYEVRAWEARSTATSPGGVTLHLLSRYPGD